MVPSTMQKQGAKAKAKTNDVGMATKCNKLLITVTVLGSTGPIRLLVKGDNNVTTVIGATLRIYEHQGRFPLLGSDAGGFLLHPANAGYEAMSPTENIGSRRETSFVLSKKERSSEIVHICKGRGWRAWLHKFLSLKILSH